jgi:hypothetical protein
MKQYGICLLVALCAILHRNIAAPARTLILINYEINVRAADQVKSIFQSTLKAANQGNVSAHCHSLLVLILHLDYRSTLSNTQSRILFYSAVQIACHLI